MSYNSIHAREHVIPKSVPHMSGDEDGVAKVLAGRRMYHISMGLLEAALYGVPISFFGRFMTAQFGSFIVVVFGLAVWSLVTAWILRRADARFRKSASSRTPTGDASRRLAEKSQTSVLKYAAVASIALLAFALLPALLSPLIPAIGIWVPFEGLGFFSFAILLAFTALFSLGGMVSSLRNSIYPEYPGFVASLLFALAMIAFFFSYIIASA